MPNYYFMLTGLLLMVYFSLLQSSFAEKDWSLGCFKLNLSSPNFQVAPGNYYSQINLTAATCIQACSSLNNNYKHAGLTANGVCLCNLVTFDFSQTVANISCVFPSSNGRYIKVYPVALPNLTFPDTVAVFQEFQIKITGLSSGQCSYVIDMDDGRLMTVTNQNLSVNHTYKASGVFMVQLSSEPSCLLDTVVVKIKAILPPRTYLMSNNTLLYPCCAESTKIGKECDVQVFYGVNVTIYNESKTVGILPDTAVKSLGLSSKLFYNEKKERYSSDGTFIVPEITKHDGVVAAFEFYASRAGNIKFQFFSVHCQSNKTFCFGECIDEDTPCRGSVLSCGNHTRAVSSKIGSFSKPYQEKIIFASKGYNFHVLSSLFYIKKNSVFGFTSSSSNASLHFFNDSRATVFYYSKFFSTSTSTCIPSFIGLPTIVSMTSFLRLHYYVKTTLLVSPVQRTSDMHLTLTSNSWSQFTSFAEICSQEKISGFQLVSPKFFDYYAANKTIEFMFNVTTGNYVVYSGEYGDGLNFSTNSSCNTTSHVYRQTGNYTMKITASNQINSVNIFGSLYIIEDIETLRFAKDPRSIVAEAGEPYQIKIKVVSKYGSIIIINANGTNSTWFISCDQDQNGVVTVNTSYVTPGIYIISVTAKVKYLNSVTQINSTVEVQERIANLTIYDNNIAVDRDIKYHILSKSLLLRAQIAAGTNVNYYFFVTSSVGSICLNCSRANQRLNFPSPGVWTITVIARNRINQLNHTIRVAVYHECEMKIALYDNRSENDPLRAIKGTRLVFNVQIQSRFLTTTCDNLNTTCWTYSWLLSKKDSNGSVLKNISSSQDSSFLVQKNTLEAGQYQLNVSASCDDLKQYNNNYTQSTYFDITAGKVVAMIEGGTRRDVAYNENGTLTLNASLSYDEDSNIFNSDGLTFYWYSNNTKLKTGNDSTFDVEIRRLDLGETVNFTVNVYSSSSRSDTAKQLIRLVKYGTPTTVIKCVVNCLPLVIVTERLSLEGTCTGCSELCQNFEWSLMKKNGSGVFEEVHVYENTSTGLNQRNIVIKPGFLMNDSSYQLTLRAYKNDSKTSLSFYEFKTAKNPKNGTCKITPTSGQSANTNFRVRCENWVTSFYPLTYSIRYQSSFSVNTTVSSIDGKDDKVWILWYHGYEQTSPESTLPSGVNDTDYKLHVVVDVKDRYGSNAASHLYVKVKRPKEILPEEIEKHLYKIDPVKCPQAFIQSVTTFSDIFNNDENNEDTRKLRLLIGERLAKIKVDTLPLIKQTADAIQLTVYDSEQVTYETQDVTIKSVEKMSQTLVKIASSSQKRNGQIIDETARVLLSALSLIMNASFYTGHKITTKSAIPQFEKNIYGTRSKEGQDLEKIVEETGEVVGKLENVLQNISFAVLSKKLIGEKETDVGTNNFKMELANTHMKYSERNCDENAGGFGVPRDILDKNFYSQVVAYERNPYTWHIGKSHFIQPRVHSLSFIANGKTVSINNLTKDIEICLPNDNAPSKYVDLTPSKSDPRFLVYSFQVKKQDLMETIVLKFQPLNQSKNLPKTNLFIRFGSKVSQSNFDLSLQLYNNCRNCSEEHNVDVVNGSVFLREYKRVKLGNGKVSVGLRLCPDEEEKQRATTSLKCSVNYTVNVWIASCQFWYHSKWIGDGCKIGLKTTPLLTHCFCDHLTSFGSYIVKPNPLNKFDIEDLKEGYVSLIAVLVIFLIFFLVLIWARRADQRCITKLGVSAVPDNNPNDRYRYEIAIWTGMRRNAGTQSEVTLILSGDVRDSEPRRLIDPLTKGFQRGSLEKFIVTTAEDIGDLYCIRIWHDNSKGSWFLSRVMVTDLERDERYYFICDRWLAVDEDDGSVDRLIPIASEDELVEFRHLFVSRTKQNLSDSHLWFSVLNRPPQSPFTRIQRLSCCLCILMMTMATNAMFYEAKSEPKRSSTNFIGSYSFTWDEFFIGIQSTLIIFPANLLILFIFRRIRPKPVKKPPKICLIRPSDDNNSMVSFNTLGPLCESPSDEQKQKDMLLGNNIKNQKSPKELTCLSRLLRCLPRIPSTLPHGFLYFAWLLLVVLTLGSATVVILYGMQYGNGRSLQWLLSIAVSILEDIFVMQPLKVLVLALVFALLVRKPLEGEFKIIGDDERFQDDQEFSMRSSQETLENTENPSYILPVLPPDEGLLNKARNRRLKERKMMNLINEIIVHLFFTIIIVLITYGHQDSSSNILHQHLTGLQMNGSHVQNIPEWWNWARDVLLPKSFPEKLYNMEDVPPPGFFDDQYNLLISRARLRLLRMREDDCIIPDQCKPRLQLCTYDYSMLKQDEECYNTRWTMPSPNYQQQWCLQDSHALDGYPIWGLFATYSGSGYVTELTPGKDTNETTHTMERLDWLNKQSRALFVELTTYNANINLYSSITIIFEFPSYGGVFQSMNIQPMRLHFYVGGFAFFIFSCEIIFLFFIATYLYLALKKIYHKKWKYFNDFWNLIDFCILCVSLSAIAVYIYRIELVESLMKRVQHLDGKFVNFQFITYLNEVFNCINALVITMTTIKLTKLMRFNLRISLFGKTLQRARPALSMFILQFGVVVFAFVMFGCLAFGSNINGYKNIPSTVMSLGRVILGKNEFVELPNIDPVLGPLFFFCYIFFVCWILMNMFFTILIDAYHEVKHDTSYMSNDYEILDFVLDRLKAWSGVGTKKVVQMNAEKRWRDARLKVKAVNTLGHRPRYTPSKEDLILEKTADVMERLENSIRILEERVASL